MNGLVGRCVWRTICGLRATPSFSNVALLPVRHLLPPPVVFTGTRYTSDLSYFKRKKQEKLAAAPENPHPIDEEFKKRSMSEAKKHRLRMRKKFMRKVKRSRKRRKKGKMTFARLKDERNKKVQEEEKKREKDGEEDQHITLILSDEELSAPVEQLTFEQFYRRMLYMWEQGKTDPPFEWVFELLKKSKTREEWRELILICRLFQKKMHLFDGHQASYFIKIACANGKHKQIFRLLFLEEAPRLFCNKNGYVILMKAFLERKDFASAWKIMDLICKRHVGFSRRMFNPFVLAYIKTKEYDKAIRTLVVQQKMGAEIIPEDVAALTRALHKAQQYNDILTLENMLKEKGRTISVNEAPYLIHALTQIGNDAEALEVIKAADKNGLKSALQGILEKVKSEEDKEWINNLNEKLASAS